MKKIVAALVFTAALSAQTVTFHIGAVGTGGASSLPVLPSSYQFSSTPVGNSTSITIQIVNSGSTAVSVAAAVVQTSADQGSPASSNFTIAGLDAGSVAPGQSSPFTLSFAPLSAGAIIGYLVVEVNGALLNVSTLQGTATPSELTLTCSDPNAKQCDGVTPLPPTVANSAVGAIQFGANGIPVGSSYAITFTLTNNSSAAVTTPAISLPPPSTFASAVFLLDTSGLPSTIAAGSSASFKVTYTPQADFSGPSKADNATLTVGSYSYSLTGTAIGPPGTGQNNDSLQVICTDHTGVQCQIIGGTVNLGPDPNTLILTFQLVNPTGSPADITLPNPPSISPGSAFSMATPTLAASSATSPGSPVTANQPVTIHPGYTVTFQVSFVGSQASTATLTIMPGITYTLSGQAPPAIGSSTSDVPGIAMYCGSSPCTSQTFTSQQQVNATLQLGSPSTTTPSVTLALSFSPSVTGVTDDPAISFISPLNTRQLGPFIFAPNSLIGTMSGGQSQFTFATGTTAGTLTFTLTDQLTQQTLSWSISVPGAPVHITEIQAVRESPNLVVTLNGYDNTYSAGQLSFVFSTTTFGNITVSADATSAFHQYFFTNNQTGGAFSLQASFPVTGDVTQVTSVAATVNNSAGQATANQAFQ